jgi:tol-pal system protein YbgF
VDARSRPKTTRCRSGSTIWINAFSGSSACSRTRVCSTSLSANSLSGAPGSLPPSPPAGAASSAGEQATYDAAFTALKASDYPKAIAGFRTFVATYPTSPLASNAQYWLGEAHYVNREYQNAITAFQRVTTEWPESRKAPDALVKIGFTQAALNRNGDARITLEDVVRRYPGSEAAQLAAERLKRLPR